MIHEAEETTISTDSPSLGKPHASDQAPRLGGFRGLCRQALACHQPHASREQAINALSTFTTPQAITTLWRIVDNTHDPMRWQAAGALLRMGQTDVYPLLEAHIIERHEAAVRALLDAHHPPAVDTLSTLLAMPHLSEEWAFTWAVAVLENMASPAALAVLREVAADATHPEYTAARMALTRLKDKAMLADAMHQLEVQGPDYVFAVQALAHITYAPALPVLGRHLMQQNDACPPQMLMKNIAHYGEAGVPFLIEALYGHLDEYVQRLAQSTLRKMFTRGRLADAPAYIINAVEAALAYTINKDYTA